jgi:hypothetical protein
MAEVIKGEVSNLMKETFLIFILVLRKTTENKDI